MGRAEATRVALSPEQAPMLIPRAQEPRRCLEVPTAWPRSGHSTAALPWPLLLVRGPSLPGPVLLRAVTARPRLVRLDAPLHGRLCDAPFMRDTSPQSWVYCLVHTPTRTPVSSAAQTRRASLGASYRQQGGPRGGRVIRMWLFPGKDPLQVLPDVPVEHAVEQEDEEALDRGRRVRKEAKARSPPHYTPTHRPGAAECSPPMHRAVVP